MEDEKLKQLFAGFDPVMPSDTRFMSQLRNNMEAVELIRQRNLASRRNNRIALVAAAISGMLTGVLLTLLMPAVVDWISTIDISIPLFNNSHIPLNPQIPACIITALASILTVYKTYRITVSRLSVKRV